MEIDKRSLYPWLMYSRPFPYNDQITLHPVKMKDYIDFQYFSESITIRKNSRFSDKSILKMTYLDFLIYAAGHPELEARFHFPNLSKQYHNLCGLLFLVCPDHEIKIHSASAHIFINGCEVTSDILEDLRRIILLQNGVDFDIDDFLNYDTERALEAARDKLNKDKTKATVEDYIDSLIVALHVSEEEIMNYSIRKFWRYIKRYHLYESYSMMRAGECTGMVRFKEPLTYWMASVDDDNDKYNDLVTDENSLKNKISQ